MKHIMFYCSLMIVTCFYIFTSCSDDNFETEEQCSSNNKIFIENFDDLGLAHNECLDLIFSELISIKEINTDLRAFSCPISPKECLFVIKYCVENISLNGIEDESKIFHESCLESIEDAINRNNNPSLRSSYVENQCIIPIEIESSLYSYQHASLTQLNSLINNPVGLQQSMSEISLLEDKISRLADIEEQPLLLSATSIAKNTLGYWNENLEPWVDVLGHQNSIDDQTTLQWRSVGRSDVYGGIAGFCRFGIGVYLGGPLTLKAALAWSLGTAVVTSAISVIDQTMYMVYDPNKDEINLKNFNSEYKLWKQEIYEKE